MGKLVILVLVTLLLANSLALFGLLGYGVATGRFDGEKRAQYLATWRGEKLVPPPEDLQTEQAEDSPLQAGAKIAEAEQTREILTVEMQRQQERIRSMKVAIDSAKTKLEQDRKQLANRKDQFEAAQAELNEMARQVGFTKALKIYSQMKPKYVKDEFMQMNETDVVRFVAAMKPDTAKAILERFKTTEERKKRKQIMNLLETSQQQDI